MLLNKLIAVVVPLAMLSVQVTCGSPTFQEQLLAKRNKLKASNSTLSIERVETNTSIQTLLEQVNGAVKEAALPLAEVTKDNSDTLSVASASSEKVPICKECGQHVPVERRGSNPYPTPPDSIHEGQKVQPLDKETESKEENAKEESDKSIESIQDDMEMEPVVIATPPPPPPPPMDLDLNRVKQPLCASFVWTPLDKIGGYFEDLSHWIEEATPFIKEDEIASTFPRKEGLVIEKGLKNIKENFIPSEIKADAVRQFEMSFNKFIAKTPDAWYSAVATLDTFALVGENVELLTSLKFNFTDTVIKLKPYSEVSEKFSNPLKFVWSIRDLPYLNERLELMGQYAQTRTNEEEIHEHLQQAKEALEEFYLSKKFKIFFSYLMNMGRILNRTLYNKSQVSAITLQSILDLQNVQTDVAKNAGFKSAFHYLVKELSRNHPQVLDFLEELPKVRHAKNIQIDYSFQLVETYEKLFNEQTEAFLSKLKSVEPVDQIGIEATEKHAEDGRKRMAPLLNRQKELLNLWNYFHGNDELKKVDFKDFFSAIINIQMAIKKTLKEIADQELQMKMKSLQVKVKLRERWSISDQ